MCHFDVLLSSKYSQLEDSVAGEQKSKRINLKSYPLSRSPTVATAFVFHVGEAVGGLDRTEPTQWVLDKKNVLFCSCTTDLFMK